ncbi:hypothetical protein [Cohnella sp. GbtcB17]|uniref:hypothetical protein n=1 Tax=Cohnella sp. GbtcB17 TaxID=2824762 RepID=UPI001C30F72A|nr:hypothetical protein [Cohnella sp. GbtcB17]
MKQSQETCLDTTVSRPLRGVSGGTGCASYAAHRADMACGAASCCELEPLPAEWFFSCGTDERRGQSD